MTFPAETVVTEDKMNLPVRRKEGMMVKVVAMETTTTTGKKTMRMRAIINNRSKRNPSKRKVRKIKPRIPSSQRKRRHQANPPKRMKSQSQSVPQLPYDW